MATFLEWYLGNLNYWTIFLMMAVESSFIPFPSEVVVPPAAYIAAQGGLDGFGVVLASVLGSLAGALINYYLAFFLGRPMIYKFVGTKLGKLLLLSEEKVRKSEVFFTKRGALSTFVGRLIPGIRQLISIPAGLARMRMTPFILYTTLGAGIWSSILYALGYGAASIPEIDTQDKLIEWVTRYSHLIGYTFLILVVGYIAFKLLSHRIKRTKKANETI